MAFWIEKILTQAQFQPYENDYCTNVPAHLIELFHLHFTLLYFCWNYQLGDHVWEEVFRNLNFIWQIFQVWKRNENVNYNYCVLGTVHVKLNIKYMSNRQYI